MGYGKKQPFCARKLKLKHIKRSCAHMGYGKKKPFCSGKLNLNHIKQSCAQMGYGEKQPFCAGKLNHIKRSCAQTGYSKRQPFCARKPKIHFICAGKRENSSYFLEFPSKTIFIGLSKSIVLVYLIPVHKWVMVKDSHFMPENQKIPSYFSEFSSKPHFFPK